MFKQEGCIVTTVVGHAMAQEVSHQPLTMEAWVQSWISPVWDVWWTKWNWDRFFPEYFGLPLQSRSTGAPLHGKMEKN
jgi:hypothetical protein